MRRRASLFLLLVAITFPCRLFAASTKEIQKLEKTLATARDASDRAEAAWQLGQMGATESVPALAAALEKDTSEAVRANAAGSLWNLGDASRPAIAVLTKALDDPSGAVVGNAAGALIKLGTAKSKVTPAYRRLLSMPECSDRVIALTALATEVPASELFDDAWECAEPRPGEDSDVSSDARDALRKIVGRKDRALVPRIIDILNRPTTRDRSTLISAIGDYQPAVKEAVPVLANLLTARDAGTSRAAASALGSMGSAALPALTDLTKALETHVQNETREGAANAIGKIGAKAKAAVPSLIKAVRSDKWPAVRKAAASALGEIGPEAREAIPALREALTSPDDWMRLAARNGLFRVEPDAREEVSDIADKHEVVEKGVLFDDAMQLGATLRGRLPEVYEVTIYDKFAFAEVPQSDSPSGRARYKYQAGSVTGPEEESSDDCTKKIAVANVDFSLVPKIVQQARTLLGVPAGKVGLVKLSPGIFCRGFGWQVSIEDAGFVEFRLDGKSGKATRM